MNGVVQLIEIINKKILNYVRRWFSSGVPQIDKNLNFAFYLVLKM